MYMKCRVIIFIVMLLFANNIYCETVYKSQYDTDETIEIILKDEEKNKNLFYNCSNDSADDC